MAPVMRRITPPLPAASQPSKASTVLTPRLRASKDNLLSLACSLPNWARYSCFDIIWVRSTPESTLAAASASPNTESASANAWCAGVPSLSRALSAARMVLATVRSR